MGTRRQVMKLFAIFAALAIAAHALPVDQMQEVAKNIEHANAAIEDMKAIENKELGEMDTVQKAIEGLPNSADGNSDKIQASVQEAAVQIEKQTKKAVANEETQQADALTALAKVKRAITEINTQKKAKRSLGESQAPENFEEKALGSLEQVKAILAQGTKTSNTQHKLEGMTKEAETLRKESGSIPVELGQSPEEVGKGAPSGALSMLKLAQEAQEAAKNAAPEGPEGGDLLHSETSQFKNLLDEEKAVANAENADISEMNRIQGLLN